MEEIVMEMQYDQQTKEEKELRWNLVTSTNQESRLIFETNRSQAMDIIYPKSMTTSQRKIPWICFITGEKKSSENSMKNYASLAQFAERGFLIAILHKDAAKSDEKAINHILTETKDYFLRNENYACDVTRMAVWMDESPEEEATLEACPYVLYQDNQNETQVCTARCQVGRNSTKALCLQGGEGLWSELVFDLVEDYIVSQFNEVE